MTPKIILGSALAFFSLLPFLSAQESVPAAPVPVAENAAESAVATRIASVIVFPQGARITRTAEVHLKAGEQEIILEGFPAGINPASITAETSVPEARIVSVSSGLHYAHAHGNGEAAAKLQEEINRLRSKIAAVNTQISRLTNFYERLKNNTASPARNKGELKAIDVQAVIRDSDFILNEMQKTRSRIRLLQKEQEREQLNLEIALSENKKLQAYNRTAGSRLILKIIANSNASGKLDVHYMVNSASWRPSYDMIVDSSDKTTRLVAYGVVAQQTGEDWANVPVTLSTARPTVSSDLPEFKKHLVTERFQSRRNYASSKSFKSDGGSAGEIESIMAEEDVADRRTFETPRRARYVVSNVPVGNCVRLANGRTVQNAQNIRFSDGNYVFLNSEGVLEKVAAGEILEISQTAKNSGTPGDKIPHARLRDPSENLRGLDFRYELARTENIPSTGTPHRYLLSSETFSGDFYYQIVPAINTNAYQMLAVENKRFRPILAGPANIFYGADFIGEMDLPYTQRDGKILIPLGVDPRILVERQKLNDIGTVGTFTHSRRNRVSTEILIRNRTPESIRVVCDEAIPRSSTDKIEISEPNFSPSARFNAETGIAQWSESLAPSQETKLNVRYTLEYPMNFILEERSR